MKKGSFSPVNLHLLNCEDIFNEKGKLISYFGIVNENRTMKQNKKMDRKFSKRGRFGFQN